MTIDWSQRIELLRDVLQEINHFRLRNQPLPEEDIRRWIDRMRESRESPLRSLQHLLGRPDTRLFAYGSLQPGRENHRQTVDWEGHWEPAIARGYLHEKGWGMSYGYPAMIWDPAGEKLTGSLLHSEEIDWEKLDTFEGASYCRILLPVQTEDAAIRIANAYQLATL